MLRPLALSVATLCVGASLFQAQGSPHGASRARFFYPEDDKGVFRDAKPPADDFLDALVQSEQVKEADDLESQSRESLRSYFIAVPADANSQDQVYVVTSTKLPLGSGDSDWFWVVQVREHKAKIILFVIGHSLTFQRHRTRGYRDLLQKTGTPNQPEEDLFRYDGDVYRLFRTRLRTVKP